MAEDKRFGAQHMSVEKLVTAQSIVVQRDFVVHTSSDEADSAALSFARLRNDSSYWDTTDAPRSDWKSLYPFEFPCKHYSYLKSFMNQQDPLLDVLVSNKRKRPLIVLGLGLLIVETAQVSYMYGGGDSPRIFRITRDDIFDLAMPELRSVWPSLSKSYPPQKEDVEVVRRDHLVSNAFDDPIAIEAGQPYRFGLRLSDYIDNMPNNAAIRIAIDTEEGKIESERLYLFTY